ncbi:MAG: GTPase domain-containing protein [Dokdonella sp.]
MATIDPTTNAVVIRVVYDGPPLAGKTTSVRSLARGLGGKVVVPEEIDGRTVFFDWLDYTGGLFEGRSIRCQIISVPGQATLAGRRRHLISSADVVVFVGDSTRDAQDSVGRYIESLHKILASSIGPSVGIVLQANKRDHAAAAPLSEIRQMLDDRDLKVAIVESVATEGIGIREAFVFAVRLALDRVREMIRMDLLPTAAPRINSPDDLLESLREIEGGEFRPLPGIGLTHTRLSDVRTPAADSIGATLRRTIQQSDAFDDSTSRSQSARADLTPQLPHGELPSGMIWPPVEGRVTLHEIMQTPPQITGTPRGHWVGAASSAWLVHSPSAGRFESLESGRDALLGWARVHASSGHIISSHRCIALAADGHGHYRLWQFVRKEISQLDRLRTALAGGATAIAEFLVALANLHGHAERIWPNAGCRLPLGLGTLMATAAGPRHIGSLPYPIPPSARVATYTATTTIDWMAKELAFTNAILSKHANAIVEAIDTINRVDPSRLDPRIINLHDLMERFQPDQAFKVDIENAR